VGLVAQSFGCVGSMDGAFTEFALVCIMNVGIDLVLRIVLGISDNLCVVYGKCVIFCGTSSLAPPHDLVWHLCGWLLLVLCGVVGLLLFIGSNFESMLCI
jgi:hypothetical protein